MLYDIGASFTYRYDSPANAGRHLLRLMPASVEGSQRVVASHLDIRPAVEEKLFRKDFFGNSAVQVVFRSMLDEIEFKLQCRVERLSNEPRLDVSPPLDQLGQDISAYRALDPAAPHHFVGASPRVRISPSMTGYAKSLLRPGMTALEAVKAVCEALHADIRFDGEATTVDTSPDEAFARRRGVCQDISHIMIACLRGVGVPAGYVSGFLRTIPPPGKKRLEGADAMHAWVQAWCGGDIGWVEFDPTNAVMVGTDHVVVARGRDYSDVAPIKGVLRIAGKQHSKHAVDVVPVERAAVVS